MQQWLGTAIGIEMNYHAINKYVKRKFGARLKVSRKSQLLKSPADEAVLKNLFKKLEHIKENILKQIAPVLTCFLKMKAALAY